MIEDVIFVVLIDVAEIEPTVKVPTICASSDEWRCSAEIIPLEVIPPLALIAPLTVNLTLEAETAEPIESP